MQPVAPKLSFFRKQLYVVIAVNFLSLAVAGGLLYTSFLDDYQDNLHDTMSSKLSMLSASSASSLLFDDSRSANNILASLSESPDTRFALIVDANARPFAQYRRGSLQIDIDVATLQPGHYYLQGNFYLYQPIELDGELLGYILLSADTAGLERQKHRYTRIIIVVFALSLLLAYTLNSRLQKRMIRPVNRLIELVDWVAKNRKYHRRMEHQQQDEIGRLMTGVNSMLDTIETHEKQLQDNSERLESLVALRTEQLFQRANYDALTQLPNRHLLIDRLNHGIDNADREKSSLALMFLDLDRFKVINDSLGHSVGDLLLVEVAKNLSKLVDKADSICRWGGDEFVVLVEHQHGRSGVELLAQQVLNQFIDPVNIAGHQLHVSTSIGIAMYPDDGADSMTLLKHADISMYQAKDKGPGQYCFFDNSMLNESVQRLSMESRVRHAIENQHFHLVYQPQICLSSNTLCGMEALIRWQDGDAFTPPNEFLPVVEEIGQMNALSDWVMREACRQAAQWQEDGCPSVPVAVNLTAGYFVQPNCVEKIEALLEEFGLPPKVLEIEITENTFVASTDSVFQTLQDIKELGVGIAIDDFGTGYSCMSYLRDLPVSKLKIDGTFVRQLGDNAVNDGIIEAIITLGRSLGMTLVAECIETEQHMQALRRLRCDMAQGYLFSKPLNPNAARAFMEAYPS